MDFLNSIKLPSHHLEQNVYDDPPSAPVGRPMKPMRIMLALPLNTIVAFLFTCQQHDAFISPTHSICIQTTAERQRLPWRISLLSLHATSFACWKAPSLHPPSTPSNKARPSKMYAPSSTPPYPPMLQLQGWGLPWNQGC
jgi:hypothetical protein